MSGLTLLPAVDVAGGRASQVVEGPTDAWAAAMRWVREGAAWIHLVDLDRAFGRGDNAVLLEDLVRRLPVPVQLSGGIADLPTLDWALGTGAARVVLAAAALADREMVSRAVADHGDRVVVAVDVRDGRVVSRGTDLDLGPVGELLRDHPVSGPAVRHLLVADASRDGTRTGSDLDLFAQVADLVQARVIASGGVSSLTDLQALARLHPRVGEVVLGSALYHSAFTLEQALEVCR